MKMKTVRRKPEFSTYVVHMSWRIKTVRPYLAFEKAKQLAQAGIIQSMNAEEEHGNRENCNWMPGTTPYIRFEEPEPDIPYTITSVKRLLDENLWKKEKPKP